jgi:hypothetical protein
MRIAPTRREAEQKCASVTVGEFRFRDIGRTLCL